MIIRARKPLLSLLLNSSIPIMAMQRVRVIYGHKDANLTQYISFALHQGIRKSPLTF